MILMRCLGKHSKHLLIFPIQWLRCHIKTSLHRNQNLLYSRSSLKSTLFFSGTRRSKIKTSTNQAFTSWTNGDKTWGVMPSQEQMRNNWWMENRRSHKWCLHQKLLSAAKQRNWCANTTWINSRFTASSGTRWVEFLLTISRLVLVISQMGSGRNQV